MLILSGGHVDEPGFDQIKIALAHSGEYYEFFAVKMLNFRRCFVAYQKQEELEEFFRILRAPDNVLRMCHYHHLQVHPKQQ